jgi:hypothetical protein
VPDWIHGASRWQIADGKDRGKRPSQRMRRHVADSEPALQLEDFVSSIEYRREDPRSDVVRTPASPVACREGRPTWPARALLGVRHQTSPKCRDDWNGVLAGVGLRRRPGNAYSTDTAERSERRMSSTCFQVRSRCSASIKYAPERNSQTRPRSPPLIEPSVQRGAGGATAGRDKSCGCSIALCGRRRFLKRTSYDRF